jgi:2,3-bisphosphoglycerate-independent phosphoglycerate mutase
MAGTGLPPSGRPYDELSAKDARGPFFDQGYRLMDCFLDLNWNGKA